MTEIRPGRFYVLDESLAANHSPWVLEWSSFHESCIVFVEEVYFSKEEGMLLATVHLNNFIGGMVAAASLIPFESAWLMKRVYNDRD